MPGAQLLDALDQRPRGRNVIERQPAVQRGRIEIAFELGMDQDRFQFGAEIELRSTLREVERLYTHAVAGQNQPPFLLPQRAVQRLRLPGRAHAYGNQRGQQVG